MENFKKIQVLTTNGDTQYSTTMNKNLDFFGGASSKARNFDLVREMFREAYAENKILALRNLANLRDFRLGGSGMRSLFRETLKELLIIDEKTLINFLPFIAELGRYDDLLSLYGQNNAKVDDAIFDIINIQLNEDMKSDKPSLLAKWLPSENASSVNTITLAKAVRAKLGLKSKEYRKMLSSLRAKINIIETHLTNKEYDKIDYSKVTSKAYTKYLKAFFRNDEEKIKAYLDSLSTKENLDKLGSKTKNLFPYEIYAKKPIDKAEKDFYNAMWESLPTNECSKHILTVVDGSGSMMETLPNSTITCRDVARSLGMYSSERLTGFFKDKFITFSAFPEVVDLSDCKTLSEKKEKMSRYNDISTTNMERTLDLVLGMSKKAEKADYIDILLIISDMQFDCIGSIDKSTSVINNAKAKFEKAEIPFPKIVYWNTALNVLTYPDYNIQDAIFVSGFSAGVFNEIAKGNLDLAYDFMLNALEKYAFVDVAIK